MSVPLSALTDTWNNAGTAFTAIQMNVTNTASLATSLLMDLQIGGVSTFNIDILGGIGIGGDTNIERDAAYILGLRNGTNAEALRIYNTYTDASNYERLGMSWVSNQMTITTEKAGTGTARILSLGTYGTTGCILLDPASNGVQLVTNTGTQVLLKDTCGFAIDQADAGLWRATTGVLQIHAGTKANHDGWLNYAGQTRVTSDFSVTSSTVLTNVTGLSANVAAGRTYTFEARLFVTDAAAGGVQAAIAGTATATAIQYTGWTVADNAIKGKANATALATAVGSTVTTETSGIVVMIMGTITVNAAGTLTVQMAQNTSNGTATVAKRGSYFIVQDMP